MGCGPDGTDPINSFALVSYIPGKLGDFITQLRQELVQTCVARSHVSILPPRPLKDMKTPSVAAAAEQVRTTIPAFAPFELEMSAISVFEQTGVVYCDIGRGRDQLVQLHEAMNKNVLFYDEPFTYHPHVTLVQGVITADLPKFFDEVLDLWRKAPPPTVWIEQVTFVQNTVANVWIDLEDCELRGLVPAD